MARAALITQARGSRVHSTGTHRQLDVMPVAEPTTADFARVSFPGSFIDEDNEQASFERMMRNNRAAGL